LDLIAYLYSAQVEKYNEVFGTKICGSLGGKKKGWLREGSQKCEQADKKKGKRETGFELFHQKNTQSKKRFGKN